MGAEIVQSRLETSRLEVDVAIGVILRNAVAIFALQHLGGVQEADAQLLTQIQKSHIEIVDFGLIHVRVIGVIFRDGRHCVHDDVCVRVAGLNGLHQRRVVGDKLVDLHAGIVGAKRQHHTAGLHLGDGFGDGIMIAVVLKGHDAIVQCSLRTDALFGAELLQRDQAVVVQAYRIGIA